MTYRYSDCLRGLMDSGAFLRMLSVFGSGAKPTDRCAAVVIDIDRAADLNARLNDPTGDALIRLVLGRCEGALPLQALAGRLRSNAIALLLFSDVSDDEVDVVCTAVHDALRMPMTGRGDQISLGASIGAAFTGPNCSAIAALQYADLAAQHVRANGGDATFTHQDPASVDALRVDVAA
jgi:GGDEF domain-containing protein